MNKLRNLPILFFTPFLLNGCATWSTTSIDNQPTSIATANVRSATQISEIQILETDVQNRAYISLGDITATVNKTTAFHPNPTREMVNEKLKEQAAKMGADAVTLVRYGEGGVSLWSWGSLEGKGRAIKFEKTP